VAEDRHELKRGLDVLRAFSKERDYEKLLDIILTKMMDITRADAGTLYMVEDNMLHFKVVKNISMDIFQTRNEVKLPPIALNSENIDNISAYSALKNEIISIKDVYNNCQFNFQGPKNYDKLTGYKTCSMLTLPLTTGWNTEPEVMGVIQLINSIDTKTGEVIPFVDIDEQPILTALANIAANTLTNVTHMRDMKMLFKSFVAVMTQAIDERSRHSSHHTQNVSKICMDFAAYLGNKFPPGHAFHFDDDRIESLGIAALLHDIGKIVTPVNIMDKGSRFGERIQSIRHRFEIKKNQLEIDFLRGIIDEASYNEQKEELEEAKAMVDAINPAGFVPEDVFVKAEALLKSMTYNSPLGDPLPLLDEYEIEALLLRRGTLTESEWQVMKEHVVVTGRLLDEMTFWKYYEKYADIPEWAKNHHEFLDGSGYPRQLKGDEIHLETCVITIADIFEALIADDRPYKRRVPADKALSILWEMAEVGKLNKELVKLFKESRIWEGKE